MKYILLIILLNIFGCTNSNVSEKKHEVEKDTSLVEIAYNKLGNNYSIRTNESKSFALCLKNQSKVLKSPVILKQEFFVYDLHENEIILEEEINNASVNWINDSLIEVSRPIGVVKKDIDSKTSTSLYIYNVKERKKSYK